MAKYEKKFTKPYADGYKDKPDKTTPVTAAILNMQDDTFEAIEEYLANLKTDLPDDVVINNSLIVGSGQGDNSVGTHSMINGSYCLATGSDSHAEGDHTSASGISSHAEGINTKATNQAAHAEGVNTEAGGSFASHAEGNETKATEVMAHAEGYKTVASGAGSHAEGFGTKASGQFQHAQGKYNVEDTEEKYAHIVGGGTSDTDRKNIFTLDWNGNAEFAGDVKTNDGASLNDLNDKSNSMSTDISGIQEKLAEQRGSRWNEGTEITGTSTTATVFSESGITDALVNDQYLNTSTGNTYRCTVAGAAATAKWVYTGCIKGAKGDTGATGAQGEKGDAGAAGVRGSRWTEGTAITGTSITPTVFSGTDIEDALAEDLYLNTDTGNVYRCTTAGAATVAKWVYACNIKGIKGDTGAKGDPGEKGDTGAQGPKGDTPTVADDMTVAFTQAGTRENIATGEKMSVIMGKIKKFFADLTAPAFAQMITTKADLLVTKATGYVPDAKAVADAVADVTSKLNTINEYVVTDLFGDYVQHGNAQVATCGKIAILSINISFSTGIPGYTTLGTLPEIIKPAKSFTFGLVPSETNDTSATYFEITTSGQLICYKSPTTSGFYNSNIPYFLC